MKSWVDANSILKRQMIHEVREEHQGVWNHPGALRLKRVLAILKPLVI